MLMRFCVSAASARTPIGVILSAVELLGLCPKSTRHSRVESRAEIYSTHLSPLSSRPRYRHNLRPAAPALRSEFDSHPLAQYDTGGGGVFPKRAG